MRRLLATGWLLLPLLCAGPAEATAPGTEGSIYFADYERPEGAISRVGPAGGAREQVLPGPTGSDPAVSPDGSTLAFSRDGDVWVVPSGGGTPERVTEGGGETEYQPAWSPDGLRLAYVVQDTSVPPFYRLETVDVASRGDIEVLLLDSRAVATPSFSPDGANVAFTRLVLGSPDQPRVHMVDRATQTVVEAGPLGSSSPDWSPDGTLLAYEIVSGGTTHIEVGPPGGTGVPLAGAAGAPSFSPEGDAIAVTMLSGAARVARIDRGADGAWGSADDTTTPLTDGAGYGQRAPSWAGTGPSPGGGSGGGTGGVGSGGGGSGGAPQPPGPVQLYPGRIFFDARRDDQSGEIYSILPGGGDLRRLTDHPGLDTDPDVSRPAAGVPQRVAFTRSAGRRRQIWTMRPDGSQQQRFPIPVGVWIAEDPSWAPGGSTLAFSGRFQNEQRTSIFVADDRGSARRLTTAPSDDRYPVQDSAPAFSPDGTSVAFRRVGSDWLPRLCLVSLTTGNEHCSVSGPESRQWSGCTPADDSALCDGLLEAFTLISLRGIPSWDGSHVWASAGINQRRDANGEASNPFGLLFLPYGIYADDESLGRAGYRTEGAGIGPELFGPSPPRPPTPELMPRLLYRSGEPVPRYAAPAPDGAQLVTLRNGAEDELAVAPLPATERPLRITPSLGLIGVPSWQPVTVPLGTGALGAFAGTAAPQVGLRGLTLRGGTLRASVRNRERFAVDGQLRVSRGGSSRAAATRCTGRVRARFFAAARSSVSVRARRVTRGSRVCLVLRDRRGGERASGATSVR